MVLEAVSGVNSTSFRLVQRTGAMYRYALYYAPPPGTALAAFGARWLGRDPDGAEAPASPELARVTPGEWRRAVALPRRYGFHATLKAPFSLAEGRMTSDSPPRCAGRFLPGARPDAGGEAGAQGVVRFPRPRPDGSGQTRAGRGARFRMRAGLRFLPRAVNGGGDRAAKTRTLVGAPASEAGALGIPLCRGGVPLPSDAHRPAR